MKRTLLLTIFVCGFASAPPALHAVENDETQQIQILQSTNSTAAQKRKACAQLKQTGTPRSVDALANLLPDPQLSLSARYALESMPDARAGRALLKALPKTSGAIEAGIIDSLGARREKDAIPALGKLLSATDTNVSIASATALGRIGGSRSLHLLEKAAATPDPAHAAEVDGILMCANQLLEAHQSKDALNVFEKIYASEKSDAVRVAAFRGILFASGNLGIERMKAAILGSEGAEQSAALLAAAQWPASPELTGALSAALPKVSAPVQLALIQCLVSRNETAARFAIAPLADSPDASVSIEAVSALGKLGDESVVTLLAAKASSGSAENRDAAREALLELNRGDVTAQMLASLKTAPVKAKGEIMRALAGRQDKTAVPALLSVAQNGSEPERTAAFQALGQLAGNAEIPKLVQVIVAAHADDVRLGAAEALNSVFQRTSSSNADLASFVSALQTGNNDTRMVLLPLCSEVTASPVRDALRAAVADSDADIRAAGIHALCDSKDAELLPDLLKLAHDTNQPANRFLAIRGCVRLVTQEENVKLSKSEKVDAFSSILETPLNAQEKQLVLSGLGKVPDAKTLQFASAMLDDDAVRAEAEQAVIEIAAHLPKGQAARAREVLQKIAKDSPNEPSRKAADAALKKIK